MNETKFIKTDNGFSCSNCFYFRMAGTYYATLRVPYCDNRRRMIGYNPLMFMCSDYAKGDGGRVLQTNIDWRWGCKCEPE